MTVTLSGIKSCDTMRKAQKWLQEQNIAFRFHDYKKEGLERSVLEQWCEVVGWETLLNRAGTTFRKLSDEQKQHIDQPKAIELMLSNLSMIKRPVLEREGRVLVGYKPELYAQFFA